MHIGILLFDEVEVLDFAGPFEVFSTANRMAVRAGAERPFEVVTVAQNPVVTARGGLRVQPAHTLADAPHLDLLLVPGGDVSAVLANTALVDWIRERAGDASLVASVCTGAFLLASAGLLEGRTVTTHWEDVEGLRGTAPRMRVLDSGERWVDDGDLVTSAGISAGIDMSLHLVERLVSREIAERTARQMDYDWVKRGR